MADEFKRHIAFKFRIGDILIGKQVFDQERFSFLELGAKQIRRVNIIGNIVERYDSAGDKKYIFFKLDDGSGQIQLRIFGDDVQKYQNIVQGDTVLVIGLLRSFNNDLYISPDLIKKYNPKYLLVRKLEIEKQKTKEKKDVLGKEEKIAVKDRILSEIKNAEPGGGIEMDTLIMNLNNVSPEIINQEVQKFIEEGIVFEPRPGKVRYLG